MFKKTTTIMSLLLLGACVTTPPPAETASTGADEAIMKADEALKVAQAAGGEWRLIDKATGGSAVPIRKMLSAAKKKAEAGETEEAIRLANRVATAAMLGVEQAKGQANAAPSY